jgi:hypothetical protein
LLDPDRDGTVIGAAAIQSARNTAWANVTDAFSRSALGDDLFPNGEDAHTSDDKFILETASSEIGFAVRSASLMNRLLLNDVVRLFAADSADGILDGIAPSRFGLSAPEESKLATMYNRHSLGAAAPGIGRILDVDLETGSRVDLISMTSAP